MPQAPRLGKKLLLVEPLIPYSLNNYISLVNYMQTFSYMSIYTCFATVITNDDAACRYLMNLTRMSATHSKQ